MDGRNCSTVKAWCFWTLFVSWLVTVGAVVWMSSVLARSTETLNISREVIDAQDERAMRQAEVIGSQRARIERLDDACRWLMKRNDELESKAGELPNPGPFIIRD